MTNSPFDSQPWSWDISHYQRDYLISSLRESNYLLINKKMYSSDHTKGIRFLAYPSWIEGGKIKLRLDNDERRRLWAYLNNSTT